MRLVVFTGVGQVYRLILSGMGQVFRVISVGFSGFQGDILIRISRIRYLDYMLLVGLSELTGLLSL